MRKCRYADMKRYPKDWKDDKTKVDFPKYIILVPTNEDKIELQKAFEYLHDQNIDTDYMAVNELVHEYLDFVHEDYNDDVDGVSQIMVCSELYEELREGWLKFHPHLRKYFKKKGEN